MQIEAITLQELIIIFIIFVPINVLLVSIPVYIFYKNISTHNNFITNLLFNILYHSIGKEDTPENETQKNGEVKTLDIDIYDIDIEETKNGDNSDDDNS